MTTRESSGVVALFQRDLQHRIEIPQTNPQTPFMWIKVLANKVHTIFIVICYFPPKWSRYNMVEETR